MKLFKAIGCVAVTLALILALQYWMLRIGSNALPPLGKFLNPVTGFWQNAESKHLRDEQLKLPGLLGKVTIRFDEHRIPHIFAENDHDLYYAQGYITAKDRLWEMDIQTREAAGRLSEVLGDKTLEVDRFHRRMGMTLGAENTLKAIMKDPQMSLVVNSYTDGINAYIHQLWYRDYPIEFKLLNYEPEDWKPINCAYLLKLMSETLAGGSDQYQMTNTLAKFGPKVMNELFPDYPFHEDPIIPVGTKWDFKPITTPKPSAHYTAEMTDGIHPPESVDGIGSNNWAIGGAKTKSGYPILANDPHLNLTFPSIWYQVQLSGPGVNVYGASLPGAPGIVIGYNEHISWGVTNVGSDVLDWYQIKFKDKNRTEYWYNNKWNKVTRKIEEIRVKGQPTVYDTVLYTHHGPVVYEDKDAKSRHHNFPIGHAMRWIAHDESDEFKTFYLLNRGKNYDDYRKALTYYVAPAQNFIFASSEKDIAITPNGKFPLKYKEQGKYILDGTDPADDWQGWIPADQNPTVKNPPRGFVSSANQSSTDPSYPYYLTWEFDSSYERGKRINDRLTVMNGANVDSLRVLQNDTYSTAANDILPVFFKYVDTTKLNNDQLQVYRAVKNWNKRFDANQIGATIYDSWWWNFYVAVWQNKFGEHGGKYKWPNRDVTERLMYQEPNSVWFDDKRTPQKETLTDIVNQTYKATVDTLKKHYGTVGDKWQWGKTHPFEVSHLANLPGFGSGDFAANGAGGVVNATSDGHGPSWRMVVQMGPQVKGYGVFPGGESGNPGSYFYSDMLKTWQDGKLNELLFLKSADEKSSRVKSTTTLSGK